MRNPMSKGFSRVFRSHQEIILIMHRGEKQFHYSSIPPFQHSISRRCTEAAGRCRKAPEGVALLIFDFQASRNNTRRSGVRSTPVRERAGRGIEGSEQE